VSNLEWITSSGNKIHAYRNGLNNQKGVKRPGLYKPIMALDKDGRIVKEFVSIQSAVLWIGASRESISKALSQKKKSCGYFWKYKEV
jgi:hypothetical protein